MSSHATSPSALQTAQMFKMKSRSQLTQDDDKKDKDV
jgi:hypothetical protein